MSARVELNFEESATLAELLETAVSDLRMEIADTDSYEFRQRLKDRRDTLAAVLQKIQQATETVET